MEYDPIHNLLDSAIRTLCCCGKYDDSSDYTKENERGRLRDRGRGIWPDTDDDAYSAPRPPFPNQLARAQQYIIPGSTEDTSIPPNLGFRRHKCAGGPALGVQHPHPLRHIPRALMGHSSSEMPDEEESVARGHRHPWASPSMSVHKPARRHTKAKESEETRPETRAPATPPTNVQASPGSRLQVSPGMQASPATKVREGTRLQASPETKVEDPTENGVQASEETGVQSCPQTRGRAGTTPQASPETRQPTSQSPLGDMTRTYLEGIAPVSPEPRGQASPETRVRAITRLRRSQGFREPTSQSPLGDMTRTYLEGIVPVAPETRLQPPPRARVQASRGTRAGASPGLREPTDQSPLGDMTRTYLEGMVPVSPISPISPRARARVQAAPGARSGDSPGSREPTAQSPLGDMTRTYLEGMVPLR